MLSVSDCTSNKQRNRPIIIIVDMTTSLSRETSFQKQAIVSLYLFCFNKVGLHKHGSFWLLTRAHWGVPVASPLAMGHRGACPTPSTSN